MSVLHSHVCSGAHRRLLGPETSTTTSPGCLHLTGDATVVFAHAAKQRFEQMLIMAFEAMVRIDLMTLIYLYHHKSLEITNNTPK